jgi:hypothetical protein
MPSSSHLTQFGSLLKAAVRFLAALAALIAVHPASAQTGITWATDATVGLTRGVGGEFGNRWNPLAETAVSFRRDMRPGFGIDVEVGYDWSANINNELCFATPPGRCLPDFPAFSGPLGLFGIAFGAPNAIQLRLNAGFAAYGAHTTRLGAPAAAMDVSVAPSSWLAIVAGGRAFVLPNYLGDRLMVTTWRLGLRLQSIQ